MKSHSMLLKSILPVFCLLAMLSGKAEATPVQVNEVGLSSGLAVGSLSLPVSDSPQNYFSGLQYIQVNNADVLLAYCIDPFQWSPSGNTSYDMSSDFNGHFGADAGDVAKLYSLFYTSSLGNNLNAAGFQLALWELVADGSKNLAAGLVHTTSGTDANIKAMAQSMLDALSGPAGQDSFVYTIYTSASNQDYVVATKTANQVPEPQSLALLALALGLLTLSARRRA